MPLIINIENIMIDCRDYFTISTAGISDTDSLVVFTVPVTDIDFVRVQLYYTI